jgi:hypothetical protein
MLSPSIAFFAVGVDEPLRCPYPLAKEGVGTIPLKEQKPDRPLGVATTASFACACWSRGAQAPAEERIPHPNTILPKEARERSNRLPSLYHLFNSFEFRIRNSAF